VQPLADRSPKQDSTRTVTSRDPAFWGGGVKPEHTESNQFNEDAPWDACVRHAGLYGADSFFDNPDGALNISDVFVVP